MLSRRCTRNYSRIYYKMMCWPVHQCTLSQSLSIFLSTCNQRAIYRNSRVKRSESYLGGSSNSWLWVILVSWPRAPWKQKPPLYLDQFTVKCVNLMNFSGLVHGGRKKHARVEHCTPVEDLIEQQGDQMSGNSRRGVRVGLLHRADVKNICAELSGHVFGV